MKWIVSLFSVWLLGSTNLLKAQSWMSIHHDEDLIESFGIRILPSQFQLLQVERVDIQRAVNEGLIELPLPDGTMHRFLLERASNFHPQLEEKFPDIQSYHLISVSTPSISGKLDVSNRGISAVCRHPKSDIYIDLHLTDGRPYYMSYFTDDYEVEDDFLTSYLGHDHTFHNDVMHFMNDQPRKSPFSRSANEPVQLYVYDLALTCTGEYGLKHGGTVDGVLSAMNTALSRINFVLESELAIRLQLIANNDELIHLNGSNDPFTNGNAAQMALECNNFLLTKLGPGGFDVGHVFGTQCSNVVGTSGGVGTVCGGNKGFGSSCEISTSDRFYIGIVCHELGHQFGAEHTWNNCPTAPDNQFNGGTAFEPGSGSTIMSYAGACSDQNIQSTPDFYYHNNSIEDMIFFSRVSGGKQCAEIMETGNHHPTVKAVAGEGAFIPIMTPFRLTGEGNDIDGDDLTFVWEQYDPGVGQAGMNPLGQPQGNAPIFRSIPPRSDPTRYFPNLNSVLTGQSSTNEVLPTYSRTLTFRITARDQVESFGGVAWDEIKIQATSDAGPFKVTNLNNGDTLRQGDFIPVEWDIAGTNQLPVNCHLVDIVLAADGKTFSDTLAARVPNDGREMVLIPQVQSSSARIMVAAADNIFYNVNDTQLVISEPVVPTLAVDVFPHFQMLCLPMVAEINIHSFGLLGFDDSITVLPQQVPDLVKIDGPFRTRVGDPLVMQVDFSNAIQTDLYEVILAIIAGADTIERRVYFEAVANDFSDLTLLDPQMGSSGLGTRPTFGWIPSQQADAYDLEVSTTPAFDENLIQVDDITSSQYELDELLQENQLYFWRLRPKNICGEGDLSAIRAFHTVNLECEVFQGSDVPINLSQSTLTRGVAKVDVGRTGMVNDVNVSKIAGFHTSFGDLIFELESPAGTKITLVKKQCGFSNRTFDFGLDDEAVELFNCLSSFENKDFIPQDPLERYQGEEMVGEWKLIVHDSVAGSGGRVEAWNLELCGNVFPESPTFMQQDTLRVKVDAAATLSQDILSVVDDATASDQLLYTVVKETEKGTLRRGETPLLVGDQFSQRDIDEEMITYVHTAGDTLPDNFVFTVIDGTGGWIAPSSLPIVVEREVVAAHDAFFDRRWSFTPNPAVGGLTIFSSLSQVGGVRLDFYDLRGALVLSSEIQAIERQRIDISGLHPGLYLARLKYNGLTSTKKLVVGAN